MSFTPRGVRIPLCCEIDEDRPLFMQIVVERNRGVCNPIEWAIIEIVPQPHAGHSERNHQQQQRRQAEAQRKCKSAQRPSLWNLSFSWYNVCCHRLVLRRQTGAGLLPPVWKLRTALPHTTPL